MFGWTLYKNQTILYAPACILLLILKYFSGLLEKWDDKLRNSAHTQVSKSFAVVSRRCITSSQNTWEAICPERNYSTLIWNLHGAFNQLQAVKEVYIPFDENQQIQFLMHSSANNEPETTCCHPLRELLCASIAYSFKVTTAPGLSSTRFLKLDIYNRTTCYSEVLRISGSHWGQLRRHNHRFIHLVWSLKTPGLWEENSLQKKCKMKVLQGKMPSYLNKISLLDLETLDKDLLGLK